MKETKKKTKTKANSINDEEKKTVTKVRISPNFGWYIGQAKKK